MNSSGDDRVEQLRSYSFGSSSRCPPQLFSQTFWLAPNASFCSILLGPEGSTWLSRFPYSLRPSEFYSSPKRQLCARTRTCRLPSRPTVMIVNSLTRSIREARASRMPVGASHPFAGRPLDQAILGRSADRAHSALISETNLYSFVRFPSFPYVSWYASFACKSLQSNELPRETASVRSVKTTSNVQNRSHPPQTALSQFIPTAQTFALSSASLYIRKSQLPRRALKSLSLNPLHLDSIPYLSQPSNISLLNLLNLFPFALFSRCLRRWCQVRVRRTISSASMN